MLTVNATGVSCSRDRQGFKLGANALGDFDGGIERGFRQQNAEFLAAHAAKGIELKRRVF